jgi:hypothetical protein
MWGRFAQVHVLKRLCCLDRDRLMAGCIVTIVHFGLVTALLMTSPPLREMAGKVLPVLFVSDGAVGSSSGNMTKQNVETALEDIAPQVSAPMWTENTQPVLNPAIVSMTSAATAAQVADPGAGAAFNGSSYSQAGVVRVPVQPIEPRRSRAIAAALGRLTVSGTCMDKGGIIGISVYILPSGKIGDLALSRSSGCAGLDAHVVAIFQNRDGLYKPATEDGVAVGAWHTEADIYVPSLPLSSTLAAPGISEPDNNDMGR